MTDQPKHASRGSLFSAFVILDNRYRSEMTDEEETAAQEGSSENGVTSMDWLTPEGLQQMLSTPVAEAVKQSLEQCESAPVDYGESAGTS